MITSVVVTTALASVSAFTVRARARSSPTRVALAIFSIPSPVSRTPCAAMYVHVLNSAWYAKV